MAHSNHAADCAARRHASPARAASFSAALAFSVFTLSSLSTLPRLAFAQSAASATPAAPVIQIHGGKIQGVARDGAQAFLGIPYAAPPVGELRWRAPQPPTPWAGVRRADVYGSRCPQNRDLGVFADAGGQEDCLTLNVFAPPGARAGDKRPVLVWIHGGALRVGAGSDYNPAKLAVDGKSIVVTFNYRLALLGFFAHPALHEAGKPAINYGMLDQQAVFDWVRRNVAAFGGDPENVTISGESSGGGSVLAHVASPWSKGKFQHAIAMSGAALILKSPHFGSTRLRGEAERFARDFAEKVGCTSENASAVARCLRGLPLTAILAGQRPYLLQQPAVDGYFLPIHPNEAFRTGQINRVTLVTGHTRDEGSFFVGFPENDTGKILRAEDYPAALESMYGKALAPEIAQRYPLKDYDSPSGAYAASVTAYLFACPERAINRSVSAVMPVYAYEFADRTAPSYLKPTSFPQGAAHTYEIPYLFPAFKGGAENPIIPHPNSMQDKLSAEMIGYWTGAARLGGQRRWQAYDAQRDNVFIFRLPQAQMAERSNDRYHCDFWDSLGVY